MRDSRIESLERLACIYRRPELSGGRPFDPFNLSADAERRKMRVAEVNRTTGDDCDAWRVKASVSNEKDRSRDVLEFSKHPVYFFCVVRERW